MVCDCRKALARLYEYLDGEIGEAERAAIAAHVQACRHCFEHYEAERIFHEFVTHAAPRPAARAEFKAHLLSRLAEEDSLPRPVAAPVNVVSMLTRFAVAAGLLLAVGLGGAWVGREAGPDRTPWVTLAYYHHDMLPVEEVGIETQDYSQAKAFLAAQMNPGVATLIPDAPPSGLGLHECCVMPWKDSKLGRFEFAGGTTEPVSLFLIPASAFRVESGPHYQVGEREYRSVKLGCCRAVLWQECQDYVCVMLSDCNANDLLAYAQAWQPAVSSPGSQGAEAPGGYSRAVQRSPR
ncbi:MAG TPA: zf-HC2 domain-containing protein [bacterium]|nr:zf-HC2 domain-containing protein [bacterium]